MNSLEILKNLSQIHAHTVGVFPADQIPRVWTKPTAFVFNTDDHTRPGMHWVAVYVNSSNIGYYFDSYGMPPFVPEHINRLRKNCKHFRWNVKQLQSETSDVCGQYCIMFLQNMSNGISMRVFLDNFSADTNKNDAIARNYIRCSKNVDVDFSGYGGCIVRYLQNCSSKMSLV